MSVEHHVRPIAQRERLANVVIGDQNADAGCAKPDHDRVKRLDRQRVDSGERLVEEQVARLGREAPRDLEPTLLAARELECAGTRDVQQAKLRKQVFSAPSDFVRGNPRVSRIAAMLSSALSLVNTERSCVRKPSPRCARSCNGSFVTSCASMETLPLVGCNNPAIMESVTVFPAPFGPRSPTISPG